MPTFDVAEMGGSVQFDMVDEFNMFENPHGLEEVTPDDAQQLKELYGVSTELLTS